MEEENEASNEEFAVAMDKMVIELLKEKHPEIFKELVDTLMEDIEVEGILSETRRH